MTLAFRQSAADRIAELENEVDWLRDRLGVRDEQRLDIAHALGLFPQTAQILAILYAAPGKWIAADWIDSVLPLQFTDKRIRGNMTIHAHFLRRRLGVDAIETRGRGEAYALRLTVAGAGVVKAALGA